MLEHIVITIVQLLHGVTFSIILILIPRINIDSIFLSDEKLHCCFPRIFLEYGEFLCPVIVRARYQTTTKRGLGM